MSVVNQAAVGKVRDEATTRVAADEARIAAVLQSAGLADRAHDLAAGAALRPIALNLHPDRIAGDGRLVVQALLDDGVYRSQFETGISNGGLTAVVGGDRDRWEERLFGGAYQAPGVGPDQRPRYGGLDVLDRPDGPCPRFGSCHLRLQPHVAGRATYAFGDSHTSPVDVGTADAFEPVLAALLEAASVGGAALGQPMGVAELVDRLLRRAGAMADLAQPNGRGLDDYIEVQVHGPVALAEDVASVVADPSFRGTEVGEWLEQLADRYGLVFGWAPGFELGAGEVPAGLRGPAIPPLAERVAREFGAGDAVVHAERIGRAARSVVTDPDRWADTGPPAEVLQHLKQLWHVLVHLGRPAST